MDAQVKEAIREKNDIFRSFMGTRLGRYAGRVMLTLGVQSLEYDSVHELFNKVKKFSDFTEDNDPYGEHDFGAIDHEGEKYFWKIDYYEDSRCLYGSEDKLNCYRVLTIMRADEY